MAGKGRRPSEVGEDEPSNKRAKLAHDHEEGSDEDGRSDYDEDDAPLYESDEDDETGDDETGDDETGDSDDSDDSDDVDDELTDTPTFVDEAVPSMEPQGPDGVWHCILRKCIVRIEAADTDEGQEKVSNHLLKHSQEIEARHNLVLKEARPYLKVE
jgi:hypothetical protein